MINLFQYHKYDLEKIQNLKQSMEIVYRTLAGKFHHMHILSTGPLLNQLKYLYRKLTDLDTDINMDFEENSPYQEGVISEIYQRPDRSYFQEAPELDSLINTGRLVQTFYQSR